MLHWLHDFLPDIPHHGYVLVFIVVFLNNLGVPFPGETILLGSGFVLGATGKPLWPPMMAGAAASFLGGMCAFWVGQRLGQGGLEKIQWLHLTPERMRWPEQFFKSHGVRTVFISRFIFILPPVLTNLLAGMSRIPWRSFLFYNLAGSVAYSITYVLLGYFFGRQWKRLEAWLGPTTLYLICAAIVFLVLGVLLRKRLMSLWARRTFLKRK
jgi:membrane protein DedA with SNARE-associated domain